MSISRTVFILFTYYNIYVFIAIIYIGGYTSLHEHDRYPYQSGKY